MNTNLNKEKVEIIRKLEHSEKQLTQNIIKIDGEFKKIEPINKEKDELIMEVKKLKNVNGQLKNAINSQDDIIKNQNLEIKKYYNSIEKQKSTISSIEKQRDTNLNEIGILKKEIDKLNKIIQEKSCDISILKNSFDDKNNYIFGLQKSLNSQISESVSMRRDKQKLLTKYSEMKQIQTDLLTMVKRLNDHIYKNQEEIISFKVKIKKSDKKNLDMQNEINTLQYDLKNIRNELNIVIFKNQEFIKEINVYRQQISQLHIQLNETIKENESNEFQLTYKDNEIRLLKDKLNEIQQCLSQNEIQNKQQIEEIIHLNLQITKLTNQKCHISQQLFKSVEMKRNILQLKRKLSSEKTNTRLLINEFSKPVNIHSWRLLKINNPNKFKSLEEIHILRKKFLSCKMKMMSQEKSIQGTQQLYLNLKISAEKLPPYNQIRTTLMKQQALNRNLQKKLKAVIAELNNRETGILSKNLNYFKGKGIKNKKLQQNKFRMMKRICFL